MLSSKGHALILAIVQLLSNKIVLAPVAGDVCGLDDELEEPVVMETIFPTLPDPAPIAKQPGPLNPPNSPSVFVTKSGERIDLSLPFDARKHPPWAKCESISHIWNQGNCGICYAIVAAAVLSDHLCIAGDRQTTVWISAGQAASCRIRNRSGRTNCITGGSSESVFLTASDEGLNTGGPKSKYGGCAPYKIPNWKQCFFKREQEITCQETCSNGVSIKRDKISTHSVWLVPLINNEMSAQDKLNVVWAMKRALRTRGPIAVGVVLFQGFGSFYFGKESDAQKIAYVKPVNAVPAGAHDVRVVGWDMCQGGIECWIIANSWGSKWGINGFGYIAILTSGMEIERLPSGPIVHHPDAPTENTCSTATFCTTPIDQALPANPMDPEAPFYLIQRGCAQRVTFQRDNLVTLGKAVPTLWVFPEAPTKATITRYTLVRDSRMTDNALRRFIGLWIYNANHENVYCRPVTDNKLACSRTNPDGTVRVAPPEDVGPAARAMYYTEAGGLQSFSYERLNNPGFITSETGARIPVPDSLVKKFGSVTGLLYVGSNSLAFFGTTRPNGAGDAVSGIYKFTGQANQLLGESSNTGSALICQS